MKLRKVGGRLASRSAIAAIAMLIVLWWLWWVLALLADWDWLQLELVDDFLAYFRLMAWHLHFMTWGLYFIVLIALIGCLLFVVRVVRDVYIHGVANKHGRITIVARVLGALGASAAFIGFLALPLFPIGIPISLMAIRGVKLALARPKVAGVLMLLAGIVPWIVILLLFVLATYFRGLLHHLPSDDPLVEALLVISASTFYLFPASFFLISGGVAAFLSAGKKRHQERLANMSNS